ncbi:protein kinase domain-containing protein [Planctomyces sp. SH-PL62]|uniref:protein kinase domain-containing protein n=1 Tax=Planctomyces sp. SH-PL62 TaxID=1636152 RepID=UPI00078B75D9|nr:protein kinase [Planctomyces sp. SH-PL62]AMV38707.1 Serine/threonine-protein kinase PrkC [Planctomyces sp. SH-PL62]
MTQFQPLHERDDDQAPTLFEGETLSLFLRKLGKEGLDEVRRAVAGIGEFRRGGPSSPMQLSSLGPYKDLEEIGRGGMGVVFRAFDPVTARAVAVKIPSPEATAFPSVRRRFLRETEAVRSLDHPAIVPHLDSGEDGDHCYLVSEYCDGPDLEDWLKANRAPISPREAARIIRTLADAIEHAHEHNILHRDIKPSNVLLPGSRLDSGAESLSPRLTDFGLAKMLDAAIGEDPAGTQVATAAEMLLGSPPYMAPEQARGREADRRSDVYGLGAVLYELLTGRPPFRGESKTETLRMVVHDEPVRVRDLRPGAPRPLEIVALKCLEKNPDLRYATAADLRDDLDRFLNGRRILARPPGLIERGRRWSRRHPRAALSLAGSLMAILVVIVGFAAWNLSLQRITEELRRSRDQLERNGRLLKLANAELVQERDRADENAESARNHFYASQVRVAAEAFQDGQVGRSQQILQELRPGPGEADRRGFAWRYLWRLTRREARELPDSNTGVDIGRLSPDERWMAWVDQGSSYPFGIYDLTRERPAWTVRSGALTACTQIAFSPDGRRVAFGGAGKSGDDPRGAIGVEIRDVETGRIVTQAFTPPNRFVRSLAFLDSGRKLTAVVADVLHEIPNDAAILRWECREGRIEEPESSTPIAWIQATHDGVRHAAVTPEGRLGLYDASSQSWVATFPEAPVADLGAVQFSEDDRRLAVGRRKARDLAILDVASGRPLRVLPGLAAACLKVAFQPDGEGLLLLEENREVRLLDPSRGLDVLIHEPTSAPGVRTTHLRFIPDGSAFLVHRAEFMAADHLEIRSSDDGRLLGESPGRAAQAGEGTWLVRRTDGPSLIYGLGRHTWRWDLRRTLEPDPATALQAHRDEVWGVAYTADGKLRATIGNEERDPESIKLWDARSGRLLRAWKGHEATVSDLAFSPDGKLLATTSLAVQDPIRIWDVASGREIATLDLPGDERARAVAFDPTGRRIYFGGDRGTVFAWDVARKTNIWMDQPSQEELERGRISARLHDLAVSPDGRHLACADDQGRVRIRDVQTGNVLMEYVASVPSLALAYSPDGRFLAVSDREGRVHSLDAGSARLLRTIHGDDAEIRALVFSPDGRTLAAGGLGRVVRLWIPETGDELMTLEGHEAQINALAFSPDGDTLASADHSGVVRFWRTRPDAPR